MDNELEIYFRNYSDMFRSDGFKQLISELTANATQLADIQTVKDADELHYRKGQVAALATVINLEATVTANRDQLEAESAGDLDV